MNLELMAMRWLRWEARCMIVMSERSPRSWSCGRPDVIGVTCARYVTEIEIKRSLSDFRADGKKRCRINREHHLEKMPKLFYYFVPFELYPAVQNEVPEWAGLITHNKLYHPWGIQILRGAPKNNASKRLSVKECVQLAHLMTNQSISSLEAAESFKVSWQFGHDPYMPLDTVDFQI